MSMMKWILALLVMILGGGGLWYQFAYAPAGFLDVSNEEGELVEGQVEDEGDREPPQELLWTWQWIETTYSGVEKVRPNVPETFQVTFQEDETFSATTDCNAVSGTFEIYDDRLLFGPFAMTKRACPGATQQDIFVSALGEMNSYEVEGDVLMLYGDDGITMTFQAVE